MLEYIKIQNMIKGIIEKFWPPFSLIISSIICSLAAKDMITSTNDLHKFGAYILFGAAAITLIGGIISIGQALNIDLFYGKSKPNYDNLLKQSKYSNKRRIAKRGGSTLYRVISLTILIIITLYILLLINS